MPARRSANPRWGKIDHRSSEQLRSKCWRGQGWGTGQNSWLNVCLQNWWAPNPSPHSVRSRSYIHPYDFFWNEQQRVRTQKRRYSKEQMNVGTETRKMKVKGGTWRVGPLIFSPNPGRQAHAISDRRLESSSDKKIKWPSRSPVKRPEQCWA